ncbi:DUF881 domain-containing protein [Streptomyces sp. NPDC046805]|uniref:DUF881 domain-containing protein n=1 Tax=Streptomyces sp. NPDC046805 TaxID=3155134 RepID=UPI0033C593AE
MSNEDERPEKEQPENERYENEQPGSERPENERSESKQPENERSETNLRRELPAEVRPSAPEAEQDSERAPERKPEHKPDHRQHKPEHKHGHKAEPAPEPTPTPTDEPESALTGRQRLAKGLWPPRVTRAQLIVALLLFGLGFGLAVQVASNSDSDSALRGARQEDLVRILDELDDRTQRLEDEKQGLEKQSQELKSSSDQAAEARKQTAEKERQLGILAGTVAAQGPGITMTIDDTKGRVRADMLLDAIQELRAAGAEAIQVNGVRVVAGTYLTDSGHSVSVDGNKIRAPYRFKVIGKPQDLEPALNIPGGVVQTLEKEQATVTVDGSTKIVIEALRRAKQPDYARSSSQ